MSGESKINSNEPAELLDSSQRRRGLTSADVPSRFEQLWGIEQIASYLALKPATLYGWRCRKYGPPSYRLGNKIRYRPEEVREWVNAQEVRAWIEEQDFRAS